MKPNLLTLASFCSSLWGFMDTVAVGALRADSRPTEALAHLPSTRKNRERTAYQHPMNFIGSTYKVLKAIYISDSNLNIPVKTFETG